MYILRAYILLYKKYNFTDICKMLYILIIVVIIILIYLWRRYSYESYTINGIGYKVSNKYQNPEEAAAVLDYLNRNNIELLRHLRLKYKNDDLMSKKVQFLLDNYNPEVIFEHIPIGTKNTSFVVDKGESVGFCLREKISGKDLLHDKHTLMFVNLHELSHMYNITWGHERDFWQAFKFILKEAKEAGIHDPVNYSLSPIKYCGLAVKYNPYFDNNM